MWTHLLLPLLLSAGDQTDAVRVSATLTSDSLTVGETFEVAIDVAFADGVTASKSGSPALFLQLDVPPSAQPTGRRLETYKELAQNEFLQEPWERLLTDDNRTLGFELVLDPAPGEFLSLNIVGYVRSDENPDGWFLRRRLELELKPGATSRPAKRASSNWGIDDDALQIGAKAPAFSLPLVDGSGTFDLSEHLGKRNVIVTTYRAFW